MSDMAAQSIRPTEAHDPGINGHDAGRPEELAGWLKPEPDTASSPVSVAQEAPALTAQPALVVGAGGNGHRTVLALKAALVEIYGRVPAGIRLLCFDIDDESLSAQAGERLVALEPGAERFTLGPLPVARIRQNLALHETIAERFATLGELPPIAAAHAAKAQRPIGALAIQWRFPHVRDVVRGALEDLVDRDNHGDGQLRIDAQRGVKVIQVGSLCGGTNSGMFLDLGYLLRSELERLGALGDACACIGVGMLPGAFRGTNSPNLVPNTVAALRELEAVMLEAGRPLHYRDGTTLAPARPPFDMYLLVDAVDESGRIWPNRDRLSAMVARALMVLCATRVGEQGEVQIDNLDEVLAGRTREGHGTFFGGIGLAELRFPAAAVRDLLTARHAARVLDEVVLPPAEEGLESKAANAWAEQQGLAEGQLPTTLARDDTGTPLGTALALPESIRDAPGHEVAARAIRFADEWLRVHIAGDHPAWIHQHAEQEGARLHRRFATWLRAGLANPAVGHRGVRARLLTLSAACAGLVAGHGAERASATAEARALEQAREADRGRLQQAAEAGWLMRRARVQGALDAFVRNSERLAAARLRATSAEAARGVVAALGEAVEQARSTLERRIARLRLERDAIAHTHRRLSDELLRHEGHPALRLVDEALLDTLHAVHAPAPAVTWAEIARRVAPEPLDTVPDEVLLAGLRAASLTPFAPVLEHSVERIVAQRDEGSPKARLRALRDAALPSLNLDLTRLPGGDAALRRVEVIGVADRADSIFAGASKHLVSTHDPHAVLALTINLGVPCTALRAWPEYEEAYRRALQGRPLHVLPDFQAGPDDHELAFALCLVFGFVHSRGVYFYYRPADELEREHTLGQGGEKALASFGKAQGLARRALERVDRHIGAVGSRQAVAAMRDWSAPADGDGDLGRDLKRLVRDHADEIDRNTQLGGSEGR